MSTNLSNFNSKVNLAKLISQYPELEGFNIQTVPPFGEFVYNTDYSSVCNIFDLWVDKDSKQIKSSETVFEDITTKYQHLLRDPVIFNEYKQKSIGEAERMEKLWRQVVAHSQKELHNHVYAIDNGAKISLAKYFIYKGYTGVIDNNFGHISQDTINEFGTMYRSWKKLNHIKKPIIVPYYYTPKHIAYIEVFDAFDIEPWKNREILYRNEFAGFTGTLGHILPDFKALMNRKGCLWNYTLDYWNKDIVTIDDTCTISNLINIFKTSKFTKFDIDPVQIIKDRDWGSKVYPYLRELNKEQALKLQEILGYSDILDKWKSEQSTNYTNGDIIYLKKPEGYFSIYRGVETRLTNFIITLVERIKKDNKTYYVVDLIQGDKSATFEIPHTKLNSKLGFINYLRELCYDGNLEAHKIYQPSGLDKLTNFIFDYFDS